MAIGDKFCGITQETATQRIDLSHPYPQSPRSMFPHLFEEKSEEKLLLFLNLIKFPLIFSGRRSQMKFGAALLK